MVSKVQLICVLAIYIQGITACFNCGDRFGNGYFGNRWGFGGERFGYGGYGYGHGYSEGLSNLPNLELGSLATSRSSELVTTCRSPKAPTGISVKSENSLTGDLSVIGTLPFLAAVGFDGALQNGGCGTVDHNCGDGEAGMKTEERFGSGYGYGARYGGYGGGFGGGCRGGCGHNYEALY